MGNITIRAIIFFFAIVIISVATLLKGSEIGATRF